ncbi:SpaH/EbpB family LPXTG-anchored major pilin [Microbacterium sp. A93]|uniref:SpaH/EbpB family LPXTG-anchored major pilin n=1 Tax=unclassified Microbacterium TaxID=2609290 RepID=UPI003F4406D8
MNRHKTSRATALLSALALGTLAVVGGSTAAFAAPAEYGNIDFSQTGSLTVHKYLHQAAGGTVGDISEAPAPGDFTNPVEDVVFTAYPLLKSGAALDLTAPATWEGLNTITPGAACAAPAGYTLGAAIPMPATDAAGASAQSLPIGVYQVCETSAPDYITEMSQPFILSIPMPHEDGWVYDVHAYPKNGMTDKPVKTVSTLDGKTGLGSTQNFPVSQEIPRKEGDWTQFAISDALDPRLKPLGTGVLSVKLDGAALDADYYTVASSPVGGKAKVTVSFTPAGLAWLNETPRNAHAGKTVEIVFTTKVVSIGADGIIHNTAEFTGDATVESNEVTVNWGSIELQKRAAATTGATGLLQGAVFEVYNAVTPYAADCTTAVADAAAGPLTVDGETTFTSDAAGVVKIGGLFVSDSVNPSVNALTRCYVVKETVAPAGYVVPAVPFTGITVKAGVTSVADSLNADIVNNLVPPVRLPLTGANGQLTLLYAGGAAAVIAIGLVLVNRRRARVNN